MNYVGESSVPGYIVVELKDGRRVRWATDGINRVIEFGSLNPANANYRVGGKVIGHL